MMKIMYLQTHWTPAEANSMLEFLDQLRDQIAQEYGDRIADYFRELRREQEAALADFPDEDIPF